MAYLIDGKSIARDIRAEVKEAVDKRLAEGKRTPGLNLLLVGEDPASKIYVRMKARDCEKVGITSTIVRLPDTATQDEVLAQVQEWNNDPAVHGILVQLPLPKHIDEHLVIRNIDPLKDVDGFHPVNAGKLLIGLNGFVPCTPYGVIEMLRRSDIDTSGMNAVIVGRSNIVGKPLAMLLAQRSTGNATVTICHTGTKDLASYTKRADLVIAAAGVKHMLNAEHIREGAVVIDVGINRITKADGTDGLTGDVDFDAVEPIARAITPVPGGVGPMTRAMLLKNTIEAAEGLDS